MQASPNADVLILANDPSAAERWRAALLAHDAEPDCRVWTSLDDESVPERFDLVISDRAELPSFPADAVPGVVRIGASGEADVHLPADVDGPELRLACRLLAEIVRLRRRQSESAQLNDRLRRQTQTDPLTGLPNRRAWDAELEQLTQNADSDTPPICVALLDLDHFKTINSTHGYTSGDQVLHAAAEAIRTSLRDSDFAARLGGDEFGLLLRISDTNVATTVVDRVRRQISTHLAASDLPPVTASAGLHVTRPNSDTNPIDKADGALRLAKREGRARTIIQK